MGMSLKSNGMEQKKRFWLDEMKPNHFSLEHASSFYELPLNILEH